MALREWQATNSPITYWFNMVSRYLELGTPTYNPDMLYIEPTDHWTFLYGLPEKEAEEMCQAVYKETLAKVTIEVADPMVLQIKKGQWP